MGDAADDAIRRAEAEQENGGVEVIEVSDSDIERALTVREPKEVSLTPSMTVDELVGRRNVVVDAMHRAMEKDVHYGTIPGVQKPALLKPGAEMLNVLFQLAPSFPDERQQDVIHDNGHRDVKSLCVLTHIPSGLQVAEAHGACSTREKKYAYRSGTLTCPECGASEIRKSKQQGKDEWYCWRKQGGCGATFPAGTEAYDKFVEEQKLGASRSPNPDLPDSWNCVTPDTLILTRDLRWVPAGDLVSGDVLIGVQEGGEQYGRPYEDGIVTVGECFEDDLYEIHLEDGRTVRCNGEHRWLVKGTNGGVEWAATAAIYEAMTGNGSRGRPRRSWRILSTGIWSHEDSAEAGYLAGLLDADGSRRFEGNATKVVSIFPAGRGELVPLGTTSHTYVAEGLICHNTVLKMSEKRALIAATLLATGASDVFTQDVEDQPGPGDSSTREPVKKDPPLHPPIPRNAGEVAVAFEKIGIDSEWISQAIQVMFGSDKTFADLDQAQRNLFGQRMGTVFVRMYEGAAAGEINIEDAPGPKRSDIRHVFASVLEGVELPGPPWRMHPVDYDPGEEQYEARTADSDPEAEEIPFGEEPDYPS